MFKFCDPPLSGKIHMYFVTSVFYEITCITSNTDKPDSGVKSVDATVPTRNTSRDVQRKKVVSEQINLHGMVDISANSAIVMGKFFSRFNVVKGHDDYKYACVRPVLKKDRFILPASPAVLLSKTPRVLRICATIFSSTTPNSSTNHWSSRAKDRLYPLVKV